MHIRGTLRRRLVDGARCATATRWCGLPRAGTQGHEKVQGLDEAVCKLREIFSAHPGASVTISDWNETVESRPGSKIV
jgi:hypothetical protein